MAKRSRSIRVELPEGGKVPPGRLFIAFLRKRLIRRKGKPTKTTYEFVFGPTSVPDDRARRAATEAVLPTIELPIISREEARGLIIGLKRDAATGLLLGGISKREYSALEKTGFYYAERFQDIEVCSDFIDQETVLSFIAEFIIKHYERGKNLRLGESQGDYARVWFKIVDATVEERMRGFFTQYRNHTTPLGNSRSRREFRSYIRNEFKDVIRKRVFAACSLYEEIYLHLIEVNWTRDVEAAKLRRATKKETIRRAGRVKA